MSQSALIEMTLKWHLTRLRVRQITQTEKYVFHCFFMFQCVFNISKCFESSIPMHLAPFRGASSAPTVLIHIHCVPLFMNNEGEQSLWMSRLIPTVFLGACWKERLSAWLIPNLLLVSMQISCIHRYINANAKYPTIIIAMTISIVHILTDSLPLALPLLLVEPTRVQCLEPKSSMPNVWRYSVSTTIEIVRNSTWNISW